MELILFPQFAMHFYGEGDYTVKKKGNFELVKQTTIKSAN